MRPFQPADHALAAAADRHVRGAARGADLDALAGAGYELLTYPGRGYAAHLGGAVKLLAALDDAAAAALLRTVLARTPAGTKADVDWLGADQQWAIDVAVAARLELRPVARSACAGRSARCDPTCPEGPSCRDGQVLSV